MPENFSILPSSISVFGMFIYFAASKCVDVKTWVRINHVMFVVFPNIFNKQHCIKRDVFIITAFFIEFQPPLLPAWLCSRKTSLTLLSPDYDSVCSCRPRSNVVSRDSGTISIVYSAQQWVRGEHHGRFSTSRDISRF